MSVSRLCILYGSTCSKRWKLIIGIFRVKIDNCKSGYSFSTFSGLQCFGLFSVWILYEYRINCLRCAHFDSLPSVSEVTLLAELHSDAFRISRTLSTKIITKIDLTKTQVFLYPLWRATHHLVTNQVSAFLKWYFKRIIRHHLHWLHG